MNRSIIFVALFVCVLCAPGILAQVVYNNGQMYVTSNAIVQINGGIETDGAAATFENQGTVTVDNGNTFPFGDFIISNAANVQGNGIYNVENNWDNSAVFSAGNSSVLLDGADQLITGSAATTFNNLELTGTGIKTQTIDATVSDTLQLNDRELATDMNTMFVTNTSNTSVMNDLTFGAEGFVSSVDTGSLSWVVASTSTYLFPVGSSSGTTRYRPVELTPNTFDTSTFKVRMANVDASDEGYDRASKDPVIYEANELFYHRISAVDADIAIYYDPISDGEFNSMAQWDTPNSNSWNNMQNVSQAASTGNYSNKSVQQWSDFTSDPFILVRTEELTIPNVFSPNADGINDLFRIPSSGLGTYKISIFNRWGTMIFESEAPEIVWDGRTFSGQEVPVGVYFYVLEAEFNSGNDIESIIGYPSGHITLVRN